MKTPLVQILPSKSVEDRKKDGDVYVSASQITTFRECRAKWAWDKLDRLPRSESTPAQKKGTRVHKILENYLKDGTPPDPGTEEGRIALAGIKFLPDPQAAVVEGELNIMADNVNYIGFIDFEYVKDGVPVVGDHKTTGNLDYAKTKDDLKKDVQAIIYAAYMIEKHQTEVIGLNWVYYKTKSHPESFIVALELDREAIAKEFNKIQTTAKEMMEAHESGKKTKDLVPNPNACGNYGGCQYLKQCILNNPKWKETDINSKRARRVMEKLEKEGHDSKLWEDKLMSKLTLKEKLALRKSGGTPEKVAETPEITPEKVAEVPEIASKKCQELVKVDTKSKLCQVTVILIDCLPLKAQKDYITLDEIAQPIIDQLNKDLLEHKNIQDYRLVEYNEGTKELCVRMDDHLTNTDLSDKFIIVSTSSQLGRDLLDVVVKHADVVFKGIR